MTVVNVHYAKTNLSQLLARVAEGEEIVIARGATPVAKLAPLVSGKKKRVFGRRKGEVTLDDGFFEPLPEDELALWNGEGD